MKVTIKNSLLNSTIEILYKAKLSGKKSRHRTRFIKQVGARLELIGEEERDLLKAYCELDGDGEPKKEKGEDGKEYYKFKDIDSFHREQVELYEEEMTIEGEDNRVMLLSVREALDESDEVYSGQEAIIYDYLCEQFKVDEDIQVEEEPA